MPSAPTSLSASFNAFLFATVYEGPDAMPVSVISALARLDLDPWTEAAELARMPPTTAVDRLSSLLAGVTGGFGAQPDRESTVVRLVGLLPAPATGAIAPAAGPGDALASPYVQGLGIMWLIILASMAVSAWVAPSPAGGSHAPAAKPTPAAVSGR